MSEDNQPPPRKLPEHVYAVAVGAVGGISINVVSDDLGYRWTPLLWALLAAVGAAWWARRLDPRTPLVGWLARGALGGALVAAVLSVLLPPALAVYPMAVAAILVIAGFLVTAREAAGPLLLGIGLVGGGISLAGFGFRGLDTDGFAALVRSGAGVLITVTGFLMVRGRFRAAGRAVMLLGLFFCAVAVVLATAMTGPTLLMAFLSGALGLAGLLIGVSMTEHPTSLAEMSAASARPLTAVLGVVYLSLGAVAVLDGRVLLAVADFAAGIAISVAVLMSLTRSGVDVRWSMCAGGMPCFVDGVETMARGQVLGGAVTTLIGVALTAVLITRFGGRLGALWRYARTVPPDGAPGASGTPGT